VQRVISHVREDVHEFNARYTRLREQLRIDMRDLNAEMQRRRYNTWAIALSMGALLFVGGYGFWRQWAADEVSLISAESLRDPKLRADAEQFLVQLCQSAGVRGEVATLLEGAVLDVAQRPSVQRMLEESGARLARSEQVNVAAGELASDVLSALVREERYEEMRAHLAMYVRTEADRQLRDSRNTRAASSFLWSTVKTAVGLGPAATAADHGSSSSGTVSDSASARESAQTGSSGVAGAKPGSRGSGAPVGRVSPPSSVSVLSSSSLSSSSSSSLNSTSDGTTARSLPVDTARATDESAMLSAPSPPPPPPHSNDSSGGNSFLHASGRAKPSRR
jgi:hypothetical protein